MHGGIYYFRKSKELSSIYKTCIEVSNNYGKFHFKDFKKPADEPIIALAMAVNGEKPIDQINNRMCYLRNTQKLKADFFDRSLEFFSNGCKVADGHLIHFGTSRTVLPIYQIEKRKVDYEWSYKKKWNLSACLMNFIAAYAESFILLVRFTPRLLIKKLKI